VAKIKNRARLKVKLQYLPEEIKKQIRPAMEKGADQIVGLARQFAPRGATGELVDSINWVYGDAPRGSVSLGKNKPNEGINDMKITVFAGDEKAYYARWVEFGTRGGSKGGRTSLLGGRKIYRTHPGTAPQPFFYPAYRTFRKRVAQGIKSAVRRAIKKAA
jgi:HK97 gp10 family phage protein